MKIIKKIAALFMAFVLVAGFLPAFTDNNVYAWGTGLDEEKTTLTVKFDSNGGTGSIGSDTYSVTNSNGQYKATIELPYNGDRFKKTDYYFAGWKIAGSTFSEGASVPLVLDNSDVVSGQFAITVYAVWSKTQPSSSGSSSSGSVSSSSYIYGTYNPGNTKATGSSYKVKYEKDVGFYLEECSFTLDGYEFAGWEIDGEIFAAKVKVTSSTDFVATATWKAKGIVIGGNSTSSSSVSSSVSSTSSTSASSVSSKASSASSKVSSKSSSVSSIASSSVVSSSEPVIESEPEPVIEEPVFEPIKIAYSISGDIPVSGVEFVLNSDIGGNPELGAVPLDEYSNTDEVTGSFIKNGDCKSAFDLTLNLSGAEYTNPFDGTVTYTLNGTQAGADSNYKDYCYALIHVMEQSKYTGSSYYMLENKTTYLYDVSTGNKSEVGNIVLVEKDGVCRPVLVDVNSLSHFAYLAGEGKIVEVVLMPDKNAESVSIDVTSLSPVMLVQLEIGDGESSSAGIPGWVWIIIAVLVVAIVAVTVMFVLKKNGGKPTSTRKINSEANAEPVVRPHKSSSVTGFDDEDI